MIKMKNKEVKEHIQLIKQRVGDSTLKILQEAGIDVDKALQEIVKEKLLLANLIDQERKDVATNGLPSENCMTSELVHYSYMHGDNAYKEEMERRFALLKLTQEQIKQFVEIEVSIIVRRRILRPTGLAYKYFLKSDTTIESLPKPTDCLSSEIISMVDDANAAWVRDHEWLSEQVWAAVCYIRDNNGGSYHNELIKRFKKLKLKEWQIRTFVKNECMIISRLKWACHSSLAWKENTIVTPK